MHDRHDRSTFSPRARCATLSACLAMAALAAGCEGTLSADGRAPSAAAGADAGQPPARGAEDSGAPDPKGDGDPIDRPACDTPQAFLERTAWSAVVEPVCVGCHIEGGIAPTQGSEFVLWGDATLAARPDLSLKEFFAHNLEQFEAFSEEPGAEATFVRKAIGELDHGGGAPVAEGSDELDALVELARRIAAPDQEACEDEGSQPTIEERIDLRDPAETFRKASVMFAGRLPTRGELAAIEGASGEQAWEEVDRLVRGLFEEPAFHEWIKYAWNEVFHFRGMRKADVNVLSEIVSGHDFSTRHWSQMSEDKPGLKCSDSWDGIENWERFNYESLRHCDGPGMRRGLTARIGWSLMEGPLEFIAWLIREGRPFHEVLTSDKIAMNYYSSLVYYGSGQAKDNPFIAQYGARLQTEEVDFPGERGSWGGIVLPEMGAFQMMESVKRTHATWVPRDTFGRHYSWHYSDIEQYPRAGLLTDQIFLNRYPTTETNVNRHRAWAFFDLFLGVDILALADRRGDPTEAELSSDAPTIEDANCNVCHNVMDPVAGMFQDFGERGHWLPDEAWPPADQPPMLEAGFSTVGATPGELYDPAAHGADPLLALAQRTTEDARFARRMVEHAFFQVIGRYPLELPDDLETPEGQGLREAYELERAYLGRATERFVDSGYDMRALLAHLVRSSFFRARGLKGDAAPESSKVEAALSAWGSGLLATPEMFHRRVEAAIGRPWPVASFLVDDRLFTQVTDHAWNDFLFRFDAGQSQTGLIGDGFRDMYGGIDFMVYTDRLRQPSSTMSAVVRRTANEIACVAVAPEFAVPSAKRLLFEGVEPSDLPSSSEARIKEAIGRLHARFLGPHRATPDEIEQSYELFAQVQREGIASGAAPELPYHCRATEPVEGLGGPFTPISDDPHYTMRAYVAVITALVLDFEFLYEI